MKLYGVPFSPFVQRVLIAGRIKGHELPVLPPPGGALDAPEFAGISPMRRIPVLETADGWTLCESAAIIAYLDEALPGPALLPEDIRARARARLVAGLVDTEFSAGLRHYVAQKLFGMPAEPSQLAYGKAQLERGLDAIERISLPGADEAPSVADAALIPFLALSDIIAEFTDVGSLHAGRPGIDAYWAQAKVGPLGAQTLAEMHGGFAAVAGKRRQQAEATA